MSDPSVLVLLILSVLLEGVTSSFSTFVHVVDRALQIEARLELIDILL
jgi:hypothetical protein